MPAGESTFTHAAMGTGWDRIVFQSWRDGNWEIYSAYSNGTNATRLTNSPWLDVRPRMSNDMSKVVFSSDRNGNYDIFSMQADGTGVRQLTDHYSRDDYPAWSPDGRRVVYSDVTDEGFDLFVMNADGSNSTRITYGSEDDVMATWSPDGQRIAWVRKQGSDGWLVVADPDGGNMQAITPSMRYCQHPKWSRDGSLIAFDADEDGDYWSELLVVETTGTGLRRVYDMHTDFVDVTMGAWSPNDSQMLATLMQYVLQDNTLYLASLWFLCLPAEGGTPTVLDGSGLDMSPDWQPKDLLPPTAGVEALPPVSPSPIVVRLTGQDNGLAGVASWDVQVRTSAGAPWKNWLVDSTSAVGEYLGSAGQSYQFRARAYDGAGNVGSWPAGAQASTTVETLPPISSIGDLPDFIRTDALITFVGTDPGGSGIRTYEGSYRYDSESSWRYFEVDGVTAAYPLQGSTQSSCVLRSRATDWAGNQEATHAGIDEYVTMYAWGAMGRATDSRGRPLAGVKADTTPAAFAGYDSDGEGNYAAYVGDWQAEYTVAWLKDGYLSLPAATHRRQQNAEVDVVMPSGDNLIMNWGFEEPDLETAWNATGVAVPVVDADAAHTGVAGTRLGYVPFEAERYMFPESPDTPINPILRRDGGGSLHLVWVNETSVGRRIYYARRSHAGVWSTPECISGEISSTNPRVVLGDSGLLHVVWGAYNPQEMVYYTRRALNGTWLTPESLGRGWSPNVQVDAGGTVHCVWAADAKILYSHRSPSGQWSPKETITVQPAGIFPTTFVMDQFGPLHIFWPQNASYDAKPGYVRRDANGVWSPIRLLSEQTYRQWFALPPVVDALGRVHFLMAGTDDNPGSVLAYFLLDETDNWTSKEVARASRLNGATLVLDSVGRSHILWQSNNIDDLHYARGTMSDDWAYRADLHGGALRSSEGMQASLAVDGADLADLADGALGSSESLQASLALDSTDRAHVAYLGADHEIHYGILDSAPDWPVTANVSRSPLRSCVGPSLVLSLSDLPQIVWVEAMSNATGDYDLAYADPKAPRTADSILRQTVELPAGMAGPTLSWLYHAQGALSNENAFRVFVEHDGVRHTLFTEAAPTGEWRHAWADMSRWAGQTITVEFRMHQTAGQPAGWVDLDEVTLGAGYHADLYAHAGSRTGAAGEPVTVTLRYGNSGDTTATAASVTMMLPSELTFVSASPMPGSTSPELVWLPGDVSPGAVGTISIVVRVSSDAPAGALFEIPYDISLVQGELETANNAGVCTVFVGGVQTFMPVAAR